MSERVLKLLPDCAGGKKLRTLLLPTSYNGSIQALKEYLEKNSVDAVVLTGQAPREGLTVERLAVNVGDCSLADNDGVVLGGDILEKDGPAAYFSTLPIKEMCSAGGGKISNTAGTYVCNSLMYRALHFIGDRVPCGFVHIPQSGDPSFWAEGIVKMLSVI